MASEFQLLLERERLLQAEDAILPSITALYARSSSDEGLVRGSASGSVSCSDSDRDLEQEWREALQEAIEKDLQQQVRLRLGLDQSHHHPTHHHPPPLHSPHPHTLTRPRMRLRSQDVATFTRTSRNILQQQSDQSKERNRRKRQTQTKVDPAPEVGDHGNRAEKLGNHTALPSKEMQLFEYLNSKYGTPVEQLKSLTTSGTFRTRQSDFLVGGGVHIRWPVEANIIHPTPKHARRRTADKPLEPLNNWTEGSPPQAPPTTSCTTCTAVGGGRGRSVYDCSRSGSTEPRKGMLTFDSRFESGNLHQAMQIGPHEYNLILRTDLYSKKHTQWFYFQVGNAEPGVTYTFRIVNLLKKDSLYNYGMQPLLYSEKDSQMNGQGWRRVGWGVCYQYHPGYHHPSLSLQTNYYTLTWKMEFPHADDTYYLAHCYPYPYSAILDYLEVLQNDPVRGKYVKKEVLCETLAGNPCYLLTVTDFEASADVLSQRRGVVVTARVHPGETNSSWMMEGVLDRLTADTQHAKSLRSHCVFKIVPMVNPDGVVVGNYRTSLAGVDLNRVYKRPIQDLFPTVYHTKQMISDFMQERELMIYVDLHGHSRKHNVFMYGCHVPECDHTHFLNERVLPFLLSEQAPDKFCFRSCKFNVHRCKEATGRVVAWRMGVANSFTMEATFCGSTLEPSRQFSQEDLMSMGRDLCEAVYKYHHFNKSKSYQQKILGLLAKRVLKDVQQNKPDPPNPRISKPSQPQTTEAGIPAAPLPDVVTSSILTSHATAGDRAGKKHRSKHTSRALQKLMKCDIALLEAESSTSGSDSENDAFEYRRQKHGCHHRRRRRHRSLLTQTHTQLLTAKLVQEPHDVTTPPDHTPNRASQERLPALKLHASAPARLQSLASTGKKVTMMPPGHRFVNRYANRSNGGIPMFAEERLKERAEKKLRSLSMIQPNSGEGWHDLHAMSQQPPNPLHSIAHTQHILPPMPPASVQSTVSHRALQFLWRPVDSCDADMEGLSAAYPLRQSHANINHLSPESSMRHYQSIKGLVEARKRRQPPHAHKQLGALLAPPTGHTHKYDRLKFAAGRREDRGMRVDGGRAGAGSHAHFSPRLARYISEIWSKNVD